MAAPRVMRADDFDARVRIDQVRRIARRLAAEARDDAVDEGNDVLAQEHRPRRRRPGIRRARATLPCAMSNTCARGARATRCTPRS